MTCPRIDDRPPSMYTMDIHIQRVPMSRYYTLPSKRRSCLGTIAAAIKIGLLLLVGILVVLALLDMPNLPGRLAGLQADAPTVGLIAGHWQHDSGAVCPDGLEEVEINLQIARHVAQQLRRQGYRVEVLPEFSPRLNGYRADVLLSIHSDSCIELSGFKVSRMTQSAVPEMEDRLVQLLYEHYAASTGLMPHPDTITEDMRQYHALRKIARDTPGAIIECGFMGGDRHLLTQEQDRAAAGIAGGLAAFVQEQRALTLDEAASAEP
jgi:N-acetylmuramoyl-L-alanine amidase